MYSEQTKFGKRIELERHSMHLSFAEILSSAKRKRSNVTFIFLSDLIYIVGSRAYEKLKHNLFKLI